MVSVGVVSLKNVTSKAIIESIELMGHDASLIETTNVKLTVGDSPCEIKSEFDVALLWQNLIYNDSSLDFLGILESIDGMMPTVNNPRGMFQSTHKVSSLIKIAEETDDIEVPETVYSMEFKQTFEESERFDTTVEKPLFSGGGKEVSKISPDEDISLHSRCNVGFIQKYIPTSGEDHWDVRTFVVGNTVVGAMKRQSDEDEWLTNISKGGRGHQIQIPDKVKEKAVKATNQMDLDVAGVDLIQNKDGKWFLLELNSPASFSGLNDVTGINVAPYIGEYCIRKAGGEINRDVDELAWSMEMPEVSDKNYGSDDDLMILAPESVIISGETETKEVDMGLDREFHSPAIDRKLAAELELGPVKDISEDPRPGLSDMVPVISTPIQVDEYTLFLNACLVSLENYETNIIRNGPLLNQRIKN